MHHAKSAGIAAAFATAAAITAVAAAPASAAQPAKALPHHHYATGLNTAKARAAERAGLAAQAHNHHLAAALSADAPSSASLAQYAPRF